jgi:hypothetical protein
MGHVLRNVPRPSFGHPLRSPIAADPNILAALPVSLTRLLRLLALRSGCMGTVWGWLVAGDFPSSWANVGTRLEDKNTIVATAKTRMAVCSTKVGVVWFAQERPHFAPPVQMIKLTETREITAYRWCIPTRRGESPGSAGQLALSSEQ